MKKPVIELGVEGKHFEDVIEKVGAELVAAGYVTEKYVPSVIERENELPTGLRIGATCVAIPHTENIDCINKSNVAIAVLQNDVLFGSLVDPQDMLPVKVVFLLAIKDPNMQLVFLKNLARVLQTEELLSKLAGADNPDDVTAVWEAIISNEEFAEFVLE